MRIKLPAYLAVLCVGGRALFTALDEVCERGATPDQIRGMFVAFAEHVEGCGHCAREWASRGKLTKLADLRRAIESLESP